MTTQSQTGPGATPASGTEPLPHFPMVIGGRRVESVTARKFETVDPFRGQPWATAPDAGAGGRRPAVAAARAALAGSGAS